MSRKLSTSVYPGHRYGLLTVIAECADGYKHPNRRCTIPLFFCQCQCGEGAIVRGPDLRSGHTRSCGCKSGYSTHGQRKHRNYGVWTAMRDRCRNPNNPRYASYGGRGITVCSRWDSFESFLADMGPPTAGLSLDRIDNDKGYCPENCRWATRSEQQANKRNNVFYELNGERLILAEWSRRLGVDANTIKGRLASGWSFEDALTRQPRPKASNGKCAEP